MKELIGMTEFQNHYVLDGNDGEVICTNFQTSKCPDATSQKGLEKPDPLSYITFQMPARTLMGSAPT